AIPATSRSAMASAPTVLTHGAWRVIAPTTRRLPRRTFRAKWLARAISAITARGRTTGATATCGSRPPLRWVGRRIALDAGYGAGRGVGSGSTMRPGDSLRSTTGAGFLFRGGGVGARARWFVGPFGPPRSSDG